MIPRKSFAILLLVISSMATTAVAQTQDAARNAASDIQNIVPRRARAQLSQGILQWRLDNLLPDMMREAGLDMWIVIDREDNGDPVSWTLSGGRRSVGFLVFYDAGGEAGIERLRGGFGRIRDIVQERDPRRIGINVSERWRHADGLSATNRERLQQALGDMYAARLVSAEEVVVRWLETRSPREISVYRHVMGVADEIMDEAFSNRVIIPDVTTTNDVAWWVRQRIADLGLGDGFFPTITLQRSDEDIAKYDAPADYFRIDIPPRNLLEAVIRRGDIISSDWGISYLGLFTDHQRVGYILRENEADVPAGLQEALRQAGRLQELLAGEFREGRTGNEILFATLAQAKQEGMRPEVYSHPIGFHGHGAGPSIGREGLFDDDGNQLPTDSGEYRMHYNTAHSMELDIEHAVPEWDGKDVRVVLEQGAVFTEQGVLWLDGRQTEWYVIR